jgi:pimeloyl-ACP methyl ester carboxylesterase
LSRGLKILTAILIAVAALLAINTIVVGNETKDAGVTIDGGEILSLPGGDVQVYEEGTGTGAPIVLLHCYSCSLHWWDELAPILAAEHRVIRIDLLGHGGSQKPSSGYSMEDQAGLVAGALDQLDVQGAVVVGHSMGFSVAVALAARASQLVDRLVNIDEGPSEDDCSLPFLAKVGYWPVVGEALRRLTPNFAVRDAYADAFAPGFDPARGFPNADQVVEDYEAMTFTSFKESASQAGDFVEEATLDTRLRQIPVPLLSIFGTEDQICDPDSSQEAYAALPGARTELIRGAGHSPNVEKPEETAALIEEFAAGAAVSPPPRSGQARADGPGPGRDRARSPDG